MIAPESDRDTAQVKQRGGSPVVTVESWPRNRAEFQVLVECYQDRLVRHAFRRLRRFQEAEDVVQDVFFKVYRRLGATTEVSHISAYLYRMTGNACVDALRRRKRRGEVLLGRYTRAFAEHRSGLGKPCSPIPSRP